MTAAGYEQAIRDAVASDDRELLQLLVRILEEGDEAKQALRSKGFGVTGTPLLQMVEEVPNHG